MECCFCYGFGKKTDYTQFCKCKLCLKLNNNLNTGLNLKLLEFLFTILNILSGLENKSEKQ